jgi:hypothetical protein
LGWLINRLLKYNELLKSDIKKKLFKLKEFGIVAFKSIENIKSLDEIYKNIPLKKIEDTFYKQYKKALKKLYQRNKKAKSP